MSPQAPPEIHKRKLPLGLATGSMILSGAGLLCVLFVIACAILMVTGLVLGWYGATHGMRTLALVGVLLGLLAMVYMAIGMPVIVIISGLQIFSVIGSVFALRRSGETWRNSTQSPQSTRVFALVGLIVSLFVLAVFGFGYMGYQAQQNQWRHKVDPDYIAHVAEYMQPFQRGSDGKSHFAPSLAAAAMRNSERFELIMAVPHGKNPPRIIPPGASVDDWPHYAKAIDEACDYRYVGADLVYSRDLPPLASRIIILYNKRSYDGGRYVAFVNNTQRWVKNGDLAALFADASAARATLGLPAITVDGPVPTAAPPPP